jgi:hypothetical protein
MVSVWDAASGQYVRSFEVPATALSVNWSPAGDALIVGGFFNTPVVRRAWQFTTQLIDYAKECCVARELTGEERAQFGLRRR